MPRVLRERAFSKERSNSDAFSEQQQARAQTLSAVLRWLLLH
jgi:hypothetical protein